MIWRIVKYGALASIGVCAVGGLLLGREALSYFSSSARSVRTAVKDAVPLEFELQRARDLMDDIIPEMQANIRLIAEEEVEIANLKEDVERSQQALDDQRTRLARLRETLDTDKVVYAAAGGDHSRRELMEDLAYRFDRYKEAEVVLAGKERLLETRQKSLQGAMQMLERTKTQKARMEDQILALESQHRLVQAASVGSRVQVDASKLAQTEKLIRRIKNRLDVAERVLAHEARFVEPIPVESIDEKDLLSQVDEFLETSGPGQSSDSPAVVLAPQQESH